MDLRNTIAAVVNKVSRFKSLYSQNEMATREQVINPVLRALGWDPENPEEVQPCESTEEGFPDYSLKVAGKTVLVMEAKKLGVVVQRHQEMSQVAKYAFNQGTEFCVLTNGVTWLLIRSFEEGKAFRERIVWEVALDRDTLDVAETRLSMLSRQNIDGLKLLVKKDQVLEEAWLKLLGSPDPVADAFVEIVAQFASSPGLSIEKDLIRSFVRSKVTGLLSPAHPDSVTPHLPEETPSARPGMRSMRIGSRSYEFHNAFEILVNTGNWLVEQGKLSKADCPLILGAGKRYLIHTSKKNADGTLFRQGKQLSNGLWMETGFAEAHATTNAGRLLERFGYAPSLLTVP